MNCLLSINRKFLGEDPCSLIDLVLSLSDADGFELNFNYSLPNEKEFATRFINYAMQKNLIINFHADHTLSENLQKEYLDYIFALTKNYNKKISVVYHSIFDENIQKSLEKTKIFFKMLIDYCKKMKYDNLVISIENLNELYKQIRLTKNDISGYVKNTPDLYMTYDIGHELFDRIHRNLPYVPLDVSLAKKISNVHIHTFINDDDHYYITPTCQYIDFLKGELSSLYKNGYKGDVVLEYGIYFYNDPTVHEKIISYIKSLNDFRQIFKKFSD